jgi:hypothetical protein
MPAFLNPPTLSIISADLEVLGLLDQLLKERIIGRQAMMGYEIYTYHMGGRTEGRIWTEKEYETMKKNLTTRIYSKITGIDT